MSLDRISQQLIEIQKNTREVSVSIAKIQVSLENSKEAFTKHEEQTEKRFAKNELLFQGFRFYVLVFGSVISGALIIENPSFRTILKALFL